MARDVDASHLDHCRLVAVTTSTRDFTGVVECITNLKEEERQKRVRVETATSQSDGG